MIMGIRHIGIYVKDLKQSKKFYTDLGMKVIYEGEEDWGENFGKLQIVKLKSGDYTLELVYNKKYNLKSGNKNYSHISVTVEDLNKLYKELKEKGIEFEIEPRISPGQSVKVAFCYDPNGFRLELVEIIKWHI